MSGKNAEICTVDYDGFGDKAVTAQHSLSLSPCWGSGRRWIAFTSYVEHQPYLYRLDQGARRLRLISNRPGLNTTPDWCDDRNSLALTLTMDGNAVIYGGEAVSSNGKVVARLRSGGYGYTVGKNIGLAYLPLELAKQGMELQVEVFGEKIAAQVAPDVLYDPQGSHLRQ